MSEAVPDPSFTDRLAFNKWAVRQVGQCCRDVDAGASPYGTMVATTKRIMRVGEAHSHLPLPAPPKEGSCDV